MFIMEVGKWYHIAAIRNSEVIELLINGVSIAANDNLSAYNINMTTLPITIGNSNSEANDADITIDEVRIWNEGLSLATLRTWMCKKINGDNHSQYFNQLTHYTFNAGSGPDINDNAFGGNYNQGIPVNNPQWVTSGAPIGDASYTIYNPPFGEVFNLSHPDGDYAAVQITDGPPGGLHIYRVNEAPNVTTAPDGYIGFDDHYYGVFVVDVNPYGATFGEYQLRHIQFFQCPRQMSCYGIEVSFCE